MNQKIFLLAILFLQCIYVQGQTSDVSELPNFTPPSPTAYELGKYGQIPVGMFTGTPNVNVPLYQYSTKNLTVPISLSYNSNGIKVDQLSSNVGLGWSLNIGGVVSRITRDKSDEENSLFFPEEEISEAGVRSPMALDFFYMAGMDVVDTETDLFMYNFNGYSGSFVFDNNKGIVQLPKKDIRIEHYGEGTAVGFRITTPDGVKYTFLDEEITINRVSGGGHNPPDYPTTTAWYLTRIEHPKGDIVNFIYASNNYSYVGGKTQSFQVLSPVTQATCSGSASPGYTINPSPSTTYNSNVNHVGKKLVEINSNFPSSGKILVQSDLSHPVVPGHSLVTGISVKNQSSQTIENFGFDYLFTGNNRVFLKEIAYMNPDKKYLFEYLDSAGLTSRLSFGQDHWGYYNGKSNSYLFPNPQSLGPNISPQLSAYNIGANKSIDTLYAAKGLLKKIIYPTKGSNEFIYESNTYRGDVTTEASKTNLSLTANTGEFEMGTGYDQVSSLSVPYDQEIEVYLSAYFNSSVCPSGSNTGKSKATFSILDTGTSSFVTLFAKSELGVVTTLGNSYTVGPDTNYKVYGNLQAGKNYTIRLHPTFECVTSAATLWYKNQVPQTVSTNIKTGGLRIQQVKSYDPVSNITNTNRYYYGERGTKNISSGEKGQTPYYISNTTNRIPCVNPCTYTDVTYLNLSSNSVRSLYNSSGTNTTYYKFVTQSHGGNNFQNGGEEHEFLIHNDYPGNTLFGDQIETSPWTNFGWSNGLEKRSSIFKKNGAGAFVILNETINEYKEDPRLFDEVYGYSVRKKFDLVCVGDITYPCTSQDINKVYEEYYCAASHNHIWGFSALSGYGGLSMCTAGGNDNKVRLWPHPCNGNQVGYIITFPDYLENLDIQEYKSISYWHYLDSSINIQYDEFGQNPVTVVTENYYDNPGHKQLTRQKSSGNNNNSIATTIFYPGDVQAVSDLEYDNLTTPEYNAIDKLKEVRDDGQSGLYFIGRPVQTIKQVLNSSGIILSTAVERTNFKEINNKILPEYIQSTKASNPLENRIKYLRYDNNGNLQEIAREDGPSVVYIWGYDKLYPVAKIENSTYSQIASALGISTTVLDTYNESNLVALNSLRGSLPNVMITTYTFIPLVGVGTITDPKNDKITYTYDSFGRLQYLKDKDGNILSANEYHYKNQ